MLEPIVFGILQGIFEWLPISSQGNLVLVMVGLAGIAATEAFKLSIFLHIGTLFSALVYLRKDVAQVLRGLLKYKPGYSSETDSLVSFLLLSTIITAIVGLPLFLYISAAEFAGEVLLALVGLALIITGIIQKFSPAKGAGKKLNFKDTVLLGFLQGLSIIPGISRSGITTSALLLRKYEAKQALRLSFLMSLPAVFMAEVALVAFGSLPEVTAAEAAVGIGAAFIVGLVSIHALLKLAVRVSFWKFCIAIGVIAMLPLLAYL